MTEEYCWAITQAVERSCCHRSGSRVLEFGFQLDSLLYACVIDHVSFQFLLAPYLLERNGCAIGECPLSFRNTGFRERKQECEILHFDVEAVDKQPAATILQQSVA